MLKLCLAVLACAPLLSCSDPLSKPVDLFHNLEGGEIAAQRPPPPGAGQPYPHVGTVPAKPVMPDPAFRNALRNELASEHDQKELMAADLPIEKISPPPPAATPAKPPAPPPAAPLPPAAGAPPAATSDGAPPPDGDSSSNATIPAAEAPASPAAPPKAAPAPQDAALQIVGEPVDTPGLPLVPDAPPPPATFEGVPAQPEPTPHVLPVHLAQPSGTDIFFPQDSATLAASQTQSLRDIVSHRKTQTILVTGRGEADSDTPGGQETAIDLALHRARAITEAFAAMHVPQSAMRVAARPFGRGAVVTLLP